MSLPGTSTAAPSVEVMEIFQRLNEERGLTIVLVTHENDIAQFCKAGRRIPRRQDTQRREVIVNRLFATLGAEEHAGAVVKIDGFFQRLSRELREFKAKRPAELILR